MIGTIDLNQLSPGTCCHLLLGLKQGNPLDFPYGLVARFIPVSRTTKSVLESEISDTTFVQKVIDKP